MEGAQYMFIVPYRATNGDCQFTQIYFLQLYSYLSTYWKSGLFEAKDNYDFLGAEELRRSQKIMVD